jgi:hypothetical protein
MARLRREAHARMLGNGLCTRPADLDCRLESACETCAYFRTGTHSCPSSPASATTPKTTGRPTGECRCDHRPSGAWAGHRIAGDEGD